MPKKKRELVKRSALAVLLLAAGLIYVFGMSEEEAYDTYPAGSTAVTAQAEEELTDLSGPEADEENEQAGIKSAYSDVRSDTEGSGSADEAGPQGGTGQQGETGQGQSCVDINTADAEELKTLNGIGDSKAAAIIEYRNANGSFTCIEDIMKVSGIKEGTFNRIKDNITVSDSDGQDEGELDNEQENTGS